jgi:hypothetical protein
MSKILPFCMRCFGIGITTDEFGGFCHNCGSQGTCIPMTREHIEYLQENIEHRLRYTEEQCKKDTIEHINQVKEFMIVIASDVLNRANKHDSTKLEKHELPIFTEYTPKLKHSTYGSDEYKQFLKEMQVALDHHYKNNRHHPEHHENGVKDMDLVDLIEMICDWKSATLRHSDGDILKSIEINQKRFGYSDELKQILLNTVKKYF